MAELRNECIASKDPAGDCGGDPKSLHHCDQKLTSTQHVLFCGDQRGHACPDDFSHRVWDPGFPETLKNGRRESQNSCNIT